MRRTHCMNAWIDFGPGDAHGPPSSPQKKVGDFRLLHSTSVSSQHKMTTRKHNEFLDIAPSDDESASDRGYDSEENVAKSKGRAVKRRRTANTQDFFGVESDNDESADDDDDKEEEEDRAGVKGKKSKRSKASQPASDDEDEDEDEDKDGGALLDSPKTSKPVKPLSTKPLKESKKNKTGVVYLSSLPPYLKPFALKNMIEKRNLGPITKVFLSPRMPSNSGSTRRSNSRQLYNDGWLEFQSVSPGINLFE